VNYRLWQLIDSGFPAGGFAHSGGLEAYVQHGHVNDGSLRAFAVQTLAQTGRSALPLVNAAYQNIDALPELDRLSDAFLSNPVANRASRLQGRALVTSVSLSFPSPGIEEIADGVRRSPLHVHYAPVFGAVFGALGIDRLQTQRAFLFVAVRGVVSAGVRLGLLGPYDAQGLQSDLSASLDDVIDRNAGLAPEDIAQTSPLVDLFQSTHDRLYSRLFQS
jgi:urease accessory protein